MAKRLEQLIIDATSESNTGDDWGKIVEICDNADGNEATAREVVATLVKRVQHRNVNVILFSLTVANSLMQNCSSTVKREVASRAFLDALMRQINNQHTHVTVRNRILELIKQWAELASNDASLE